MKQQTQRVSRPMWAMAMVYCVGMLFAVWFDFAITETLYSPKNLFAGVAEAFGFYPLYVPIILGVVLWAVTTKANVVLRVSAIVLALVGVGVLVNNTHGLLVHIGWAYPLAWALLSAICLLVACAIYVKIGKPYAKKLNAVCLFSIVYAISGNVIINLMKLVWARTRFDDMFALGDFSAFTAWYQPFGNGGTSFPSGHTAAACGIFVLVLLCDVFPSWAKMQPMMWHLCGFYVTAVATGRIIIGRHYLSDTLTATCVMTVLFFALAKSKWYQKLCCDEHAPN